MMFPGCCLPRETQPQTDVHLQGELRDCFYRCLELEVLMCEEFHLPLLASGCVLLDTDHLANIVWPCGSSWIMPSELLYYWPATLE